MAGTPKFKVHDADGRYVAAAVDATLAVAIISSVGSDGWRVKHDGRIVWDEGPDKADGYDEAAELIYARIDAHNPYRRGFEPGTAYATREA